ncbi:MAG: hypothetical protein MJ246_08030 [Clostridia bacterium]|nr:hypothetical protein [Clostridia bacterium]
MRRKLYLVNEIGSTFFFDYSHNCLIEELDGLGFEFDVDYEDFDGKFVETKRTIPQKQLDLTLIFIDGYVGFARWRDYVTKSKELRLFYETSAGKKYCYVNIVSSSKAQKEANILRSEIKVDYLSLWLVNKSAHIAVEQTDEGKTYPYVYPYEYATSFNGKVTVTNECSREVPLKITMVGNVYKPRIIVRQNEVQICACRLLIDERESPTIEINAEPTNQYIKKIQGTVETDIYAEQDFSLETFLFLPPGTSEIFFDPGVRERCTCDISFCEEYVAN